MTVHQPATTSKPYLVRRIKVSFFKGFDKYELKSENANLTREKHMEYIKSDIFQKFGNYWNLKIVHDYIAIRKLQ
jgi:hypothetical protein